MAPRKLTQEELNKTLEFCANAFEPARPDVRAKVLERIGSSSIDKAGKMQAFQPDLSAEEQRTVKHIRARQMMRTEDTMNLETFGTEAIDGFLPNLKHGSLGLITGLGHEPMQ